MAMQIENEKEVLVSELSSQYWRNMVAHIIRPVAMNIEEEQNRSETHFRCVDDQLLNLCKEYELQTNLQTEELSRLSGPIALKSFGIFRGFI